MAGHGVALESASPTEILDAFDAAVEEMKGKTAEAPETEEAAPQAKAKAEKATPSGKSVAENLKIIAEGFKEINEILGEEGEILPPADIDIDKYQKIKEILLKIWQATLDLGKDLAFFAKEAAKALGEKGRKYVKYWLATDWPGNIETEFQVTYRPTSKGMIVDDTLTPRFMEEPNRKARERALAAVGPFDDYVREKLGYKDNSQLWKALSADQIDGVALAIYNFENRGGKATIIGDQTGVGKGRIAAAMWTYAIRNGMVPIFFTEKPNLFSDFYRDITDIGRTFAPLIIASNIKKATITDARGNKIVQPLPPGMRTRLLRQIRQEGIAGLKGYDGIVTTYSQINKESNLQQQALAQIIPGNFLILDESHNAAGPDSNTGAFLRGMLQNAKGALYLSATYSKRADTMPVYSRTDLGDVNLSMEELVEAISAGGEPLQEIASGYLAEAGQLVRREKSFKGIDVPTEVYTKYKAEDRKKSDQLTENIRAILRFDKQLMDVVNTLMQKNRPAKKRQTPSSIFGIDIPGGVVVGSHRINSTVTKSNFAATVHNTVRQMLLCMKAKRAADEAIKEMKAGNKVILALSNTMESFLQSALTNGEIAMGEPLSKMTFSDVLLKSLRGTLTLSVKAPGSKNAQRHKISLENLPPDLQDMYKEIEKGIRDTMTDIPGSPIDYMLGKIAAAGFKVGELTGRRLAGDTSDPENMPLRARTSTEISDKNAIIRDYQNDVLDGLIINSAGSAGLSAHAIPTSVVKNPKQRVYLCVQQEQNIDTEVQKMGRINRKGQVVVPRYKILQLDIPSELRPAAIHMRKMRSLSANTSANSDSPLATKKFENILNKYGDEVVYNWVMRNPQIAMDMGIDLESFMPTKAAYVITGKMAIQPVAVQEEFYREVEQDYAAYVDRLKEDGLYDLEVDNLDFKATTVSRRVMTVGTDESKPFGRSTHLEELKVKAQRKPYTKAGLERLIDRTLSRFHGVPAEYQDDFLQSLRKAVDDYLEKVKERGRESDLAAARTRVNSAFNGVANALQRLAIGDTYRIRTGPEMEMVGVLHRISFTKGYSGNPATPGNISFSFAVNNALRVYNVSLSAIQDNNVQVTKYTTGVADDWDKLIGQDIRITRYMITGNILQGLADSGTGSRIVRFTMEDGTTREGILLPMNYRPSAQMASTVRVTKEIATKLLSDNKLTSLTSKDVKITYNSADDLYRIIVPKAKAQGGKYFLDEDLNRLTLTGQFETQGNSMVAHFSRGNIAAALDRLYQLGETFSIPYALFQSEGFGSTAQPDAIGALPETRAGGVRKGRETISPLTEQRLNNPSPNDKVDFEFAKETILRVLQEVLPPHIYKKVGVELLDTLTWEDIVQGNIPGVFGDITKTEEEHGGRLDKVIGLTSINNYSAIVRMACDTNAWAYKQTSYHEAFHIVARWLLPDKDYRALMDFYDWNEEDAADDFGYFAIENKAKALKGKPSVVKQFFIMLNKLIRRLKAALGNKLARVELIFDNVAKGKYGNMRTPEQQAARMAERDRAQALAAVEKSQATVPPLYSKLLKVVTQHEDMPRKAQSLVKWLEKKQVKPEELKWTGVHEWIEENQRDGKINRDDFIDYIRANQLHIVEKVKRGGPLEEDEYAPEPADIDVQESTIEYTNPHEAIANPETAEMMASYVANFEDNYGYYTMYGSDFAGRWVLHDDDTGEYILDATKRADLIDEIREHFYDKLVANGDLVEPVRYMQYTLHGGELGGSMELAGYKEILFTLPEGVPIAPVGTPPFRHGHWPESNVLMHARLNDKALTILPNGEKASVMLVEEVQSDWLQAAKEYGFIEPRRELPPEEKKELERLKDIRDAAFTAESDFIYKMGTKYNEHTSEDALLKHLSPEELAERERLKANSKAAQEALAEMSRRVLPRPKEGAVPPAPFLKTWHEFLMKRMLRHAAEKGAEYLAWTTGAQQAARYNLEKYIDFIHYMTAGEDESGKKTYKITAYTKEGRVPDLPRFMDQGEIADYFGAGIAKKIVKNANNRDQVLSGLDLRVGGEGMIEFYDKKLPGFMRKYVKKWGGRVSQVDVIIRELPEQYKYYGRHYTIEELEAIVNKELQSNYFPKNKYRIAEIGRNVTEGGGVTYEYRDEEFETKEEAYRFIEKLQEERSEVLSMGMFAKKVTRPEYAGITYDVSKTPEFADTVYRHPWIEEALDVLGVMKEEGRPFDRAMITYASRALLKRLNGSLGREPVPPETETVHAVQITPSMRDEVLYTGQTLFGGPRKPSERQKWAQEYIKKNLAAGAKPNATKEEKQRAEALKEELDHMNKEWPKVLRETAREVLKYGKYAKEGWLPERPDTTWLQRLLQSPEFYFETVPAAQRVLEARLEKPEIFRGHLADITENDRLLHNIKRLKKTNKEEYNRLKELIKEADQYKKVFTEKDLRDKGFSEDAITAWGSFRAIMNHGFDKLYAEMLDIINSYEKVGLEVPSVVTWADGKKVKINLKVALAVMGDMRGYYAPRWRKPGRRMVIGKKKGAHTRMVFTDSETVANMLHVKWAKEGYVVTKQKTKNMPEDVFQMMGQTIALGSMVNAAFERVESQKSPATLSDFGLSGELTGTDYRLTGPYSKEMTKVFKAMGGRFYQKDMAWHFPHVGADFEERLTNALSNMLRGVGPFDTEPLFAYSIATELANIVKGRGFRSSMIKRKQGTGLDVWEGYEEDPLTAAAQYAMNISAGLAKKEMASRMVRAITGTDVEPEQFDSYEDYLQEVKARRIDPAKQQNIYHDLKVYMEENLRNQETSDRIIGAIKAIAVFKYLGFRVSSPLVNLTAMVTSVPAAMNEYAETPWHKIPGLLAKALDYFTTYRFGDRNKLSPEIASMFDHFYAKGWADPQFKEEAIAVLRSRLGAASSAILDASMLMFGATETLNRVTTLTAGYLQARETGHDVAESLKIAKKVSDRAHGVYKGTATLPHYAQGSNIAAKGIRMFYVFSKFSHNYLQTMYEIGFKKNNRLGLLYMMIAPAILGGLGSMVGFSLISWALEKILGVDSIESRFYSWVGDTFGSSMEYLMRFGLMGAGGVGVSLKGSLKIDIPGSVPTTIPELFGAPGSIFTDIVHGAGDVRRAQWARAAEQFLPRALGAPVQAVREYKEGVTTAKGTPKFLDGKRMKPNLLDTIYRTLSFNPAHVAAMKEKKWEETKIIKKYRGLRSDIYTRLRGYYSKPPESRTRTEMRGILLDIKDYNDRVRAAKLYKIKGVSFITDKSIETALRAKR